jgi:hypothetical protein
MLVDVARSMNVSNSTISRIRIYVEKATAPEYRAGGMIEPIHLVNTVYDLVMRLVPAQPPTAT